MTARVCFSLITALLCLSVYLSTTDAEGAATVNGSVRLATGLLPTTPGVCPRKNLGVAVSGVCAEMCFDDRDCPKNKKCCSNGCGHECMVPYKEKPGVCPKNNLEDAMSGVCDEMCSRDGDCPNDEKCCSNRCGRQCMSPYEEKPGVCPSKHLGIGVCDEMCFDDRDCPKNQKCCSNGCGRQCMSPYKAGPAKPGVCPKNNLEDAVSGVCAEMCSHDRDCPKNLKCCRNRCGHQCMVPYKEKPGACPKKLGVGLCVEMCSHDSDCPKNQKCCSNGCGHQCMPPYKGPAKPGVCPKNNLEDAVSGVCDEMCSHDGDCPKNQKCCSNGCGHKCMSPYKEKPGVCPNNNLEDAMSGVCDEMCSHDGDCPNDEKCCSNGCGHQCMALSIEKPGVCPRGFDGVRLCKELCVNDIDCPDDAKCCHTKCGHACISPF